MGTRHTYRIIETYKSEGVQESRDLVLIYGQFDGYPSGVPTQVAKFLSLGTVVNGYGATNDSIVFNGAGCMAAQLIHELKQGTGTIYIHSLDSRGKSWEDYLYDIIVDADTKGITMVAYENNETPKEFFRGTPQEFLAKYSKEETVELTMSAN